MGKVFKYELFEDALSEKGLLPYDFAKKAGLNPGSVANLKRVKNIKKKELKSAIESILNVKYDDLCVPEQTLTNTEPVDTTHYESEEYDHDKSWPIVGSTRGGAWLETIESGYAGSGEGLTDAPDVKDANGYALRVLGDSMEPEFTEGGIVLVSPNSAFVNGDFAVVIIESRLGDRRESCLKKVFKHEGYITLHSLNDKYKDVDIPDREVIAIHKVILSRRTLEKKYI